jgi:hypothetical protein
MNKWTQKAKKLLGKNKQIMKNKPIRLKNILNLGLVTLYGWISRTSKHLQLLQVISYIKICKAMQGVVQAVPECLLSIVANNIHGESHTN